jgi:hypothetical protein
MRLLASTGFVILGLAALSPAVGALQDKAPATKPAAAAGAAGAAAAGGNTTPAADPPANPAPVPDADLRTFGGGQCLTEPAGSDRNLGGLAAILLPQVVGAGLDALTNALDAAGRDRILNRSTVLPLEYAVRCVQISRGVAMTSRRFMQEGNQAAAVAALERAPFLLELYFRQSRDGSALLVTPTRLTYSQTLDRRQTRSERTLYATITFAAQSGQNSTSVTVPLGSFSTRRDPYFFDPMMRPLHPDLISPLGAANSVWIPNPFKVPGGAAAPSSGEAASEPAAQGNAPTGNFAVQQPPAPTQARTRSRNARGARPQAPAPVANEPRSAVFQAGTPIAPLSVTVVISETRPGSAFARTLAAILRGSRTGIVNAVDPVQRAAAQVTARTEATTQTTAFVTARQGYADAYQAFCNEADGSSAQRLKAPGLYAAQMKLLLAAEVVHQPVPFTGLVSPETGAVPYPGFCLRP